MTIPGRYQGRAHSKGYTPPRPQWTVEQRLEECLRIADRIEGGTATPLDETALKAHLTVLASHYGEVREAWNELPEHELIPALDRLLLGVERGGS